MAINQSPAAHQNQASNTVLEALTSSNLTDANAPDAAPNPEQPHLDSVDQVLDQMEGMKLDDPRTSTEKAYEAWGRNDAGSGPGQAGRESGSGVQVLRRSREHLVAFPPLTLRMRRSISGDDTVFSATRRTSAS